MAECTTLTVEKKPPEKYRVTITVYSATYGVPLEGVSILVDGNRVGITDENGEVIAEVVEGTHKFTAKYEPYYEAKSKTVSVTSDTSITFALMPA